MLLITGGARLIGSNLTRAVLADGQLGGAALEQVLVRDALSYAVIA